MIDQEKIKIVKKDKNICISYGEVNEKELTFETLVDLAETICNKDNLSKNYEVEALDPELSLYKEMLSNMIGSLKSDSELLTLLNDDEAEQFETSSDDLPF